MNDIKITSRVEFPRTCRGLYIGAEIHKTAIVRVTNGSTGQIISLKRFEDYNEALNYFSEQYAILKMVEESEVMLSMLEKFLRKLEGE